MSESGNFIIALITGGLGAAIGSIGTAVVQTISKRVSRELLQQNRLQMPQVI